MKNTGLIYAAECLVSKRKYIGQTTQTLAERRYNHEHAAMKGNVGCVKFYRAIRKHGPANFNWTVLASDVPITQLDETESKFIAQFDTVAVGYNICAYFPTTRGIKLSLETRKRMSEAKKGRPKSIEHRKKIGDFHRGRKRSPETREKIGAAKRGIKWPADVVEKRASKLRGVKITDPERLAQVRAAAAKARLALKKSWTEERRKHMSNLFKGRVFSVEWRQKLSVSIKKALASKREARALSELNPLPEPK